MSATDRMRAALNAAVSGAGSGMSKADRLCHACVDVLTVDGASLSLMHEGTSRGTVAASGELSRRLDELQFTFGEGPCFDAMRTARPVLVEDLRDPAEQRWPAFSGAGLEAGVRAMYALPVSAARSHIGVLDLFRSAPGRFSVEEVSGGLLAAELASLPLLDLLTDAPSPSKDDEGDAVTDISALERVEVYQATGMLMAQLDCGPAEALVRLRAHAFSVGSTASEVAWQIVERELALEADPRGERPDGSGAGG